MYLRLELSTIHGSLILKAACIFMRAFFILVNEHRLIFVWNFRWQKGGFVIRGTGRPPFSFFFCGVVVFPIRACVVFEAVGSDGCTGLFYSNFFLW